MATKVGNIRQLKRAGAKYIYIGRAVPRYGLAESKWHNPYIIGTHGDRAECLMQYNDHLIDWYNQDISAHDLELDALREELLACWCAPLDCRGDVLAKVADMTPAERRAWAGVE